MSSTPAPTAKTARFDPSRLRKSWMRFKRTAGFGPSGPLGAIGVATATASSSVAESGVGADDESRYQQPKRSGVRWGRVVTRTITSDGDGSVPGSKRRLWGLRRSKEEDMEMGSAQGLNEIPGRRPIPRRSTVDEPIDPEDDVDDAEVDAVIVDNQFLSLEKSTQRSQSTHPHTHSHPQDDTGTSFSGHTGSAASGVAESRAMVILRYRVWPSIERFLSLRFEDPAAEALYRKEAFFTGKTLAFWGACYLLLNWMLGAAVHSKPWEYQDKVIYFAVVPCLTLPLPLFIMFDWPRTHPWIYQFFAGGAVWSWGFHNIIFMCLCGKYGSKSHFSCGHRDFLSLLYYVTGLPIVGIFALQQNRVVHAAFAFTFIFASGGMFVPLRRSWIRHTLDILAFHIFVLYISWMRENAERRLYVLREQLKTQYKQTQKAQISERKSSDSKRRLTSYIFHEVRVPLNTALLAAQNLAGTGAIQRESEVEFNALEGSLNMMSKVLNDVLDFNRLDSGRFETVSKPFAFHSVIRSMLVPLGLGASAKGLQLIVEIDHEIDVQARLAGYRAQAAEMDFTNGEPLDSSGMQISQYEARKRARDEVARARAEEWVAQRMAENADEDGIVMGDEMRLRQIVTNLASNACKFTTTGGKITLRTKLVIPEPEHCSPDSGDQKQLSSDGKSDGTNGGAEHMAMPSLRRNFSADSSSEDTPKALEHIVVRIEVQDTGAGVSRRDVEENRLFSAFMQTSSGLRQGGKGTGLGLALVRHIVTLSGGRLGVKSKRSMGSTFWIEIPLGVGRKAVAGMEAAWARDAALDAINFPNPVTESPADYTSEQPQIQPLALPLPEIDITDVSADLKPTDPGPESEPAPPSINGDGQNGASAEALHTPGERDSPFHGPSALRSIMEHGGIIELVPQLHASGNDGPIVAHRPFSPESTRSCHNGSPMPSRIGHMDGSTSRLALPETNPNPTSGTAAPKSDGASLKPSMSIRLKSSETSLATPKPIANNPKPYLAMPPPSQHLTRGESLASKADSVGTRDTHAPLKVLVVDDDALTRRLMTRMLTRLGCTVDNAENGQIALDMLLAPPPTPYSLRTQSSFGFPFPETSGSSLAPPMMAGQSDGGADCKYDIIFLDNHMPICNGVGVVTRLRRLARKDFVVGVTGNALTEDQQEYLQAGANYVLTKPVLEKSLKAMLVLADQRRKAPAACP